MLRYQDFLMARYWVPEYGSAEDANQFKFLHAVLAVSAREGRHEVSGGVPHRRRERRTRARARTRARWPPRFRRRRRPISPSEPILLWVDRDAGHGQGKPLNLRLRDLVDARIFVMWQLGMLGAETK